MAAAVWRLAAAVVVAPSRLRFLEEVTDFEALLWTEAEALDSSAWVVWVVVVVAAADDDDNADGGGSWFAAVVSVSAVMASEPIVLTLLLGMMIPTC